MKNAIRFLTMPIMVLMLFIGTSNATAIYYSAQNLVDTTPGQDLWQYSYTVADNTFNQDDGFTIYFDYGLYTGIDPISASSDWDAIGWDPDIILSVSGFYDAVSLVNTASLTEPFVVSFIWLGNGIPGAQLYDVYDSTFTTIESGSTTPAPVPEPASLILVGTGLMGLARLRNRKK
jgi:hypothetical protein